MSSQKIPLIFCGNINAQDYVSELLQNNFDIHLSENIRPTMAEVNTEPTRQKVHELFMENVMERAPGYNVLKNSTAVDIIPTPAGVEKILTLYAAKHKHNILMVDMGGATTDIFSSINGHYDRTVSANVGMSYSISNIMKESGIDSIMENIAANYSENDVRNYISNKMINPTFIPRYDCEKDIEISCAAAGVALAWQQHLRMNFQIEHIGFLDRRRNRIATYEFNPFEDVYKKNSIKDYNYFQLSSINMIIGAGGVIANAKSGDEAIFILADGFKPYGITKLAVDKPSKSPHLGILSELNPEEALELFEGEALREIGTVVAPFGRIKKGKEVLSLKINGTPGTRILNGGEVVYFREGGSFEIILANNILLVGKEKRHKFYTPLPVLFDCRGRGDKEIKMPISQKLLNRFTNKFQTDSLIGRSNIVQGEYEIERKLPYKGDILFKKGEDVRPEDIIGRNLFNPPKIFLIDIKRLVGYDIRLTPHEIEEGFLIKDGDLVKVNQKIFKANVGKKGKLKYFRSNVRGVVEKIEKTGVIVLREKQDYNEKPVLINLAEQLGVKPSQIEKYMKYSLGDYVEKDQIIAQSVSGAFSLSFLNERDKNEMSELEQELASHQSSGDIKYVNSPSTGHIKEIDTKKGLVTIQYITNPVQLRAFVKGKIIKVENKRSAIIRGNGAVLYGIIGFGKESSGGIQIIEKEIDDSFIGKIGISFSPITLKTLQKAAKSGIAGVVAPSINNKDWVEYCGEEIGVALTGSEAVRFTLILTEGFGEVEMNPEYQKFFEERKGKTASLSGMTQIRAGVKRPMLVVSD